MRSREPEPGRRATVVSGNHLRAMRPVQDGDGDRRPRQEEVEAVELEMVAETPSGKEEEVQGEWGDSEDGAAEPSDQFLSERDVVAEAVVRGVRDSSEDVEMGELRGAVKRALEQDGPEAVVAKARGRAAGKAVGPEPGSPALADGRLGARSAAGSPAVLGGHGE